MRTLPSKEVSHCPQTQTSNVIRVHKKGSQINMPECHQGFTLMQTHGLRFPPQPRYLSKPQQISSPPPRSPMELLHRERCSICRALSTFLSKSPEKNPPPFQVPLTEPLHTERASSDSTVSQQHVLKVFTWRYLENPQEISNGNRSRGRDLNC
jgi:hypothetical protein